MYHFYQPRLKKKVPCQPNCLRDVLRFYHDSLAGEAHLGFDRTYRAIQMKYYWPKMYQNVADYIRSCDTCQEINQFTTRFPCQCTSWGHFPTSPYVYLGTTYQIKTRPKIPITGRGLIQQISREISMKNSRIKRNS